MSSRTELRRAAMDLLARREHTHDELVEKLVARVRRAEQRQRQAARRRQADVPPDSLTEAEQALLDEQQSDSDATQASDASDIDDSLTLDSEALRQLAATVVEELRHDGLQSDHRFVESFVIGRAARLYGPLRIRQELRQRGIPAELIEQTLAEADVDWQAQRQRALEQKFGRQPAADFRERARRLRFLQYRGFETHSLDN
ncbi:MAG: regulatory protein RecX [Spongiibacteraceae bacterium]|nr:regulatory protein RecX [Spongiibacteraceae bacterium]